MKKLISLYSFILLTIVSYGQQEPIYTQFIFNKLAINPAYAGSKGVPSASLLYRDQWRAIEGAPKTLNLSFHTPILNKESNENRVNIGLAFTNDKIGDSQDLTINPSFAYRWKVGKGKISFGLHGAFRNMRTNFEDVVAFDLVDNITQQGNFSTFVGNVGLGSYYYTSKYFVGISAPYLLPNDRHAITRFFPDKTVHLYLSGGGLFQLPSDDWKLMVSGLYIKTNASPLNFDVHSSIIYKDLIWLGANLRVNNNFNREFRIDSIDGILQVQVQDALKIGLAYDYTVSSLRNVNGGTVELFVEYNFFQQPKAYYNPRFPNADQVNLQFF